MNVTCITIEGENAIISADKFDWLCAQAAKVEKLEKVVEAAVIDLAESLKREDNAIVAGPYDRGVRPHKEMLEWKHRSRCKARGR